MKQPKLFMILLGATPKGRHIEQHDVFFGIAESLEALVPDMKAFWPEAEDKIHIDAYRVVHKVGGYRVDVVHREEGLPEGSPGLFFLNLGGYKEGEFEEAHYKMLVVSDEKAVAIKQAKETAFYKHTGFGDAPSHIDDRYGVDVDDVFEIQDILPESVKQRYTLRFRTSGPEMSEDELWLGYMPLNRL